MKLSQKFKSKLKMNLLMILYVIVIVLCIMLRFENNGDFSFSSMFNNIRKSTMTILPNTATEIYIYYPEDLVAVRDNVNSGNDDYEGKTVYLMQDLDMSSVCSSTLGSWESIGTMTNKFSGTFNGNYHKIKNLYINNNSKQIDGLFLKTADTTIISNLILEDLELTNDFNENCNNSYIGGIVGWNSVGAQIINCGISSGSINATNSSDVNANNAYYGTIAGGIAGRSDGEIKDSYNKGTVNSQMINADSCTEAFVGGITGAQFGPINSCYNTGNVSATAYTDYAGGISGRTDSSFSGSLSYAYNKGTVTANGTTKLVGGLYGRNGTSDSFYGTIPVKNSYTTSAVSSVGNTQDTSKLTQVSVVSPTDLKNQLPNLGTEYVYDIININEGDPVLYWEIGDVFTSAALNANQIYVEQADTYDLNVLNTPELETAIGTPYTDTDFKWVSTNEDIALVDDNGNVTALKDGYTTIYALHETTGVYGMCIVNVHKGVATPQAGTGDGFSAVLKSDGTVWSLGLNDKGQLGDGTNINSAKPVQAYINSSTSLTNVIKIAVGKDYVIALTEDKKVYAWGSNENGQLGINDSSITYSNYAVPVLSPDGTSNLNNIVDIATGNNIVVALDESGNVYRWGDSSILLPEETDLENIVRVAVGNGDIYAIETNGKLWYGAKDSDKYYRIALDVVELSAGTTNVVVEKLDGSLQGKGSLYNVNTFEDIDLSSILIGGKTVKYIKSGYDLTTIQLSDGTVYAKGGNTLGELGIGSNTNSTDFTKALIEASVPLEEVLMIGNNLGDETTSSKNTVAILESGAIYITGDNTYGQLGDGTFDSSNYYTKAGSNIMVLNVKNEYLKMGEEYDIDILDVKEFNVYISDVAGSGVSQSGWEWTSSNEEVATVDPATGKVLGRNVGYTTITGINPLYSTKAKAIINVYSNDYGAITVPQVANGENFTVVLKEDGTVWASGVNNYGQLGNGTTNASTTLQQVKVNDTTYLKGIMQISVGSNFVVALSEVGDVFAWGYNGYGSLGQGNTDNLLYATKMKNEAGDGFLDDIIQISAGKYQVVCLADNGDVYACGGGQNNEYIDGNRTQHNSVTKITQLDNCVKVDAGNSNAIAMASNGETFAWGVNDKGQLGNGKTATAGDVKYLIGKDINDFSTSGKSTIIIKEDGKTFVTGNNANGQLGLGDKTDRTVFEETVLSQEGVKAKYVRMSEGFANLLSQDNKLYATGLNANGQLATGNNTDSDIFVPALNEDNTEVNDCLLLNTKSNASASDVQKTNSIIKTNGTVQSVGTNTNGQFGNNTTSNSYNFRMTGTTEVELQNKATGEYVRNEYIKVGDTFDIEIASAEAFNVFIKDKWKQEDWRFTSLNEDVATVDVVTGVVTGKAMGTTTITAYDSDLGIKGKVMVNVYRNEPGAVTIPQVAAGDGFEIILKEDGTVWAIGQNGSGQLADGTAVSKNATVQCKVDSYTYLTNIKKIAVGTDHVLALSADGRVYAWGNNENGQLGQDNTTNLTYATMVKNYNGASVLGDVVDIAADHKNSYVLTKDGIVYGMGVNDQNQIGSASNTKLPVEIPELQSSVKIDAGYKNVAGLHANGNLWIKGYNGSGAFGNGTTTAGNHLMSDCVADFDLYGNSSSIIRENGNLATSGANQYGQLGIGNSSNRSIFANAKLETGEIFKAKNISGGTWSLAAIGKDGKLYGTGYNGFGAISNGTTTNVEYLIPMIDCNDSEVTDAFSIAGSKGVGDSASRNTAAIRANGTIWLAGDNTYGQMGLLLPNTNLTNLGQAILNNKVRTVTLKTGDTKQLYESSFNLEADGTNVFESVTATIGSISYSSLDSTIADVDSTGLIVAKKQGITRIVATESAFGTTTMILVKVTDNDNVKVVLGNEFTLALKQDGTVWSFGDNYEGQLATGNYSTYRTPKKITAFSKKIIDIAAGYNHSVFLTEDGEVYTCGYNGYSTGVLGIGGSYWYRRNTPVKVNLTNIVKVTAYKHTTAVLDADGNIYVWGQGYGNTPRKITFTEKIIDVSGNIMLTESGKVYNLSGTRLYVNDIIKISSGDNHCLALTSTGEIISWGTNNYGQLGNGTTVTKNILSRVVGTDGTGTLGDIVEISAGASYSLAIDIEGNVYAWGYNGNYRQGIPSGLNSSIPVKIENGIKTEYAVSSIGGHSAIVDWDGFVYTTGYNSDSQLGLGDIIQRKEYTIIGEPTFKCTPNQLTLEVGQTQQVDVEVSGVFNLKSDTVELDTTANGNVIDAQVGHVDKLSSSTNITTSFNVTGDAIGKTLFNVNYTGHLGKMQSSVRTLSSIIHLDVVPAGGATSVKVESGKDFSVALKVDGTVWAWGNNAYGQLGNGNTASQNEPVKVNIPNGIVIKDISVGDYHVLALTEDGKVYAWGHGASGKLGVGNTTTYLNPVLVTNNDKVNLTGIVKVEANKSTSYAITKNGDVYVWGSGYSSRATKLDTVKNVVDITSKYVLDGNGKVYKVSDKEILENTLLEYDEKIIDLDEGTDHIVMLSNKRKAYAIGDNTFGQLGNISNISSVDIPVGVKKSASDLFTNIKEIKAGDRYTTIVDNNGNIYVVGINDNNELGIENNIILDSNSPQLISSCSNIISASTGHTNVAVIKEDGCVYAWGTGEKGQLGNRKNENSITPVMVGDFDVKTSTNRLVISKDTTKLLEGFVDSFNLYNNTAAGVTFEIKDSSVATITNAPASSVSAGKKGINVTGDKVGTTVILVKQEVGTKVSIVQLEVVSEKANVTGMDIEPMIVTKGSHSVMLRVDGKVFTYGDNTYGEIGNGTYKSEDLPTEVEFPAGVIITQVAAGENHCVALDSNGYVYTWGRNNSYQLGVSGDTSNKPVRVPGLPRIIRIAASSNSTMVITENNELYAWGANSYGELGLGSDTDTAKITKIANVKDIIDVSGGKNHFMILNKSGEVFTTGSNLYGQLGINELNVSKINKFKQIDIPEKVATISAGEITSMAATVDGEVYVWGSNTYSQLGTGDNVTRYAPEKLTSVSDIREVEAGKTHSTLRDGVGKVYVVGANSYGQLGIGTNVNQTTILENTDASIADKVVELSAGNTYTMYLREDGTVWASGDYNHGNTNKSSRTNSNIPVLVGNAEFSLEKLEYGVEKGSSVSIIKNARNPFNLLGDNKVIATDFTYTSLNEDIATVDASGKVTGINKGSTWVKVTNKVTGEERVALIRVLYDTTDYSTHVIPQVEGGNRYAIALKEDGSIWTWGVDASGFAMQNTPANLNIILTYTKLSAGKNFAIALRDDGTVWSVGSNENGQLGIGTYESKEKLTQIESLADIVEISAGDNYAIALDKYGVIYGWGLNVSGEIGSTDIGDNILEPRVIEVPLERPMQISAGINQAVWVGAAGNVYGKGSILNGKINGITDAVKVDVAENYIIILRKDGSIYRYNSDGSVRPVYGASNGIDISAQKLVNMYQSVDGKAYTWGNNASGELGDGTVTGTTLPVLPSQHSDNVFTIGTGYNNTYIVANDGFAYAAGLNTSGELGNGTSNEIGNVTKDSSPVHILVGDENYTVEPGTNMLELNEVEDLIVRSNLFNVFENKEKQVTDYIWESMDTSILQILAPGQIKGIALGVAQIKVTDPVTNRVRLVTRAVVPVNADRISEIKVDGVDATVVGASAYEVKIPVDDGVTTANLVIKTKLPTDEISIDGGVTWSTGGVLNKIIDIPNDPTIVNVTVRSKEGNEVQYTLSIYKLNTNNKLEAITVKDVDAGDILVPVKQINSNQYECIISDINGVLTIKAQSDKSNISIAGGADQLGLGTYNIVMTSNREVIPFTITSESGKVERYTITVYRASSTPLPGGSTGGGQTGIIGLKDVFVNNVKATKVDETNYKFMIDDTTTSVNVEAITHTLQAIKLYVGINGGVKQETSISKIISTDNDVTVVTIETEDEYGNNTKTYTLTIIKNRNLSLIDQVVVNGMVLTEVNGIYEAFVDSNVDLADINITAKDLANTYVKLDAYTEEVGSVNKVETLTSNQTTYTIKLWPTTTTDASGNTVPVTSMPADAPTYKLIIYRTDIETGAKNVYLTLDGKIVKATKVSATEYSIVIDEKYTGADLTVESINNAGLVEIDGSGFVVGLNTKNIVFTNSETIVPFTIKTSDALRETNYTVKIIRKSNNKELAQIEVNELLGDPNIVATQSPTDPNLYEVQLLNSVNSVEVIATTQYANSKVKINADAYSVNVATKTIAINSEKTDVLITVLSEYGEQKEYTLRIKTLSGNADIQNITVDGNTAVYNNNLGRFEIKVPRGSNDFNIKITPADLDALISVLDVLPTSLSTTVPGTIEDTGILEVIKINECPTDINGETNVEITVTSKNGLRTKTYTLTITEVSNDTDLSIVKVNGNTITLDASGVYIANVTAITNDVDIYAKTKDSNAEVTIDGDTNYSNECTITRNNITNGVEYIIRVVAEDGITVDEKKLIINKLSDNTNIDTIELESLTGDRYTPVLKPDGTYYCLIGREDSINVKVTTEHANAKISINGGLAVAATNVELVDLPLEINTVDIIIEAEDGTILNKQLIIEKLSNDTGLLEITSPDIISSTYIGNDTFEIVIDDRLTSILIDAKTTHQDAKLKLGTETVADYVVHEMLNKNIDLTTGNTSFTIDVLAADGTTSKTYTVQIIKRFSTDIANIITDGDPATNSGRIYDGWLDEDNIANVEIYLDNSLAEVEVTKNGVVIATGTGSVVFAEDIETSTAPYKIKVMGPNGESTKYVLNVTRKSQDNSIRFVKLNDKTLMEENNTYNIQIGSANNDEYVLDLRAENEYATIQVDGGAFSSSNIVLSKYTILPGTSKTLTFRVKSQLGTLSELKTVNIYRKDNNVSLTSVKVNGLDAIYDPDIDTYVISLDNTVNLANIDISAQSTTAVIKSVIGSTEYENTQNLAISDVSLPGSGKTVIPFSVTAEDGTIKTHKLAIIQLSTEVELSELTVNGVTATQRADKDYEVIIGNSKDIAKIFAKTREDASKILINNVEPSKVSTNTTDVDIAGLTSISVPVKVISNVGTEYTYTLYITIKDDDINLKTIEVNNISAEKLSETEFRVLLDNATTDGIVNIEAVSTTSEIKITDVIGDTSGGGISPSIGINGNPVNFTEALTDVKTKITFEVTAESGIVKAYTLDIIKKSSDNSIKDVYVDGMLITKDPTTGRYKVVVGENEVNKLVKVVANNEYAVIRLDTLPEKQSEIQETITLSSDKVTTVRITVRNQMGDSIVEYLDIEKVHSLAGIDNLSVDDVEKITYDSSTKTYTAYVDLGINPHEVIIVSDNNYATIEVNGETATGNIITQVDIPTTDIEKELTIDITSEDGRHEQYKLVLIKKSSNINLTEVKVDDVVITAQVDKPTVYREFITETAETAKITVTTEYPYASIKIGDFTGDVNRSERYVPLALSEDEITVPVIITAADGVTIETYNIILTRLSSDVSFVLKYNGMPIDEDYTGKYLVDVLDTDTTGFIEVIGTRTTLKIDINNTLYYETGRKEYYYAIDVLGNREIEIPIVVQAVDGTTKTKLLVLTRRDTSAETAKIEGTFDEITKEGTVTTVTKDAVLDSPNTYIIGVTEDTTDIDVKIIAESRYATIDKGSETGTGTLTTHVVLDAGKQTFISYQVTAEAGGAQEVNTIIIEKRSPDADLAKVEIDGVEIFADPVDGIYYSYIKGSTANVNVTAESNHNLAKVELGVDANTHILNSTVLTDNIINYYNIKVTSEYGIAKNYVVVLTKETNIAGKLLTENASSVHHSVVTIYKSSDTRPEDDAINSGDVVNGVIDIASIPSTTRTPIEQIITSDDGEFNFTIQDIEKYDIVVTKLGYLDYRVKNIQVTLGETSQVPEYTLVGGDIDESGEIEIDDLVIMNDNIGVVITSTNEATKGILDINEDGVIDVLDRNIIKANYHKKAQSYVWVAPTTRTASISMLCEVTDVKTDFIKPMNCDYVITSQYGNRIDPITEEESFHSGIDISGKWHTEILSIADGIVTFAGVQESYGNCIEIKHIVNGEAVYSFYAHLSEIKVQAGDIVKQGQVIALEGGAETDPNHGDSTGHHLHFEMRSNSGWKYNMNPNNYIKF